MKPEVDFVDTGWVITNEIAMHYPCNPGKMVNNSVALLVGHTYNITYDVVNYSSGGVNIGLGTTNGATRNAAGIGFTENLVCAGNTNVSFFSNGFLGITNVVIYDLVQTTSPITFSFSEKNKKWANTHPFVPDMMMKFGEEFYSFQNGAMWKHNTNQVRGSYYGTKYPSQITFYLNSDRRSIKIPVNIIVESNKLWTVPSVIIKPYAGKSLGMQSRIKTNRFIQLQGIFYADFLNNMLDPRFGNDVDALLNGEELRGRVIEITIENNDPDEVILERIILNYTKQMLTP